MKNASRRLPFFAAAFIGAFVLLAVLLMFSQSPRRVKPTPLSVAPTSMPNTPTPRPVTPAPRSAMSTPRIVSTVDDEPIYADEWERAVALDRAMSGFVGQLEPSPEETLNRLINQRLVLRAAEKAGLPKANEAQAEAWLTNFLASLNLEEEALERSLTAVGLTRSDLVEDLVPRLLEVQQALETLPDGAAEAWVADLRRQARVVVLESVAPPEPLDLPASTVGPASATSPSPDQPTPTTIRLTAGPRVGELAPDISLTATDGTTVRLSDLRGQPVVLNFWAPWCPPCREELPMLETVSTDDLVVLGIAVREPPDKVIAFATDLGLELTLLLDEKGQTSDVYQVRGLPTSLFVNGEGMIIARHVGPLDQETLDSYLALLLATAPAPNP